MTLEDILISSTLSTVDTQACDRRERGRGEQAHVLPHMRHYVAKMDTMSSHARTYATQAMDDTSRMWPVGVCVLRTLTSGTRYATDHTHASEAYHCEEHARLRGRVAACFRWWGAGDRR